MGEASAWGKRQRAAPCVAYAPACRRSTISTPATGAGAEGKRGKDGKHGKVRAVTGRCGTVLTMTMTRPTRGLPACIGQNGLSRKGRTHLCVWRIASISRTLEHTAHVHTDEAWGKQRCVRASTRSTAQIVLCPPCDSQALSLLPDSEALGDALVEKLARLGTARGMHAPERRTVCRTCIGASHASRAAGRANVSSVWFVRSRVNTLRVRQRVVVHVCAGVSQGQARFAQRWISSRTWPGASCSTVPRKRPSRQRRAKGGTKERAGAGGGQAVVGAGKPWVGILAIGRCSKRVRAHRLLCQSCRQCVCGR